MPRARARGRGRGRRAGQAEPARRPRGRGRAGPAPAWATPTSCPWATGGPSTRSADEVRDGRLYGRGSTDMKGGLAACVVAMAALRREGVVLSGPVELAALVDEEEHGLGIRAVRRGRTPGRTPRASSPSRPTSRPSSPRAVTPTSTSSCTGRRLTPAVPTTAQRHLRRRRRHRLAAAVARGAGARRPPAGRAADLERRAGLGRPGRVHRARRMPRRRRPQAAARRVGGAGAGGPA